MGYVPSLMGMATFLGHLGVVSSLNTILHRKSGFKFGYMELYSR